MKSKKYIKVLCVCLLLAVAMILPMFSDTAESFAVTVAEAKTYDELQDELRDAQAKYNAIVAARNEAQKYHNEKLNAIKDTQNKLDLLEAEYNSLEDEQSYLEQQKLLTESLTALYQQQSDEFQKELDAHKAEMDEMLELYGAVLRYKYENGNVTTLKMLFESENFEQFLSRLQYFDNIIEYNDTVVDALDKIEAKLDKAKEDYDKAVENLSENNKQLANQLEEIEQGKLEMQKIEKEFKELYEKLVDEEAAAKAQAAQLAADADILKQAVKDAEWAILNYQNNCSEFRWPLKNGVWYRISSYFGWRWDPLGRGWLHHGGLDIAAGGGNDILAVADGVITTSAWHYSYGNYVVVYHGDGISTLYAHMSRRNATVGQQVKQGQTIGYVGTTGDSTGNHLHFTVMLNGKGVNPDNYLPDGFYEKKYYPADK